MDLICCPFNRMKKKYIIAIIVLFLAIGISVVFVINKNSKKEINLVEFIELSLLPVYNVDDEFSTLIEESLNRYYYDNSNECGFYNTKITDDNSSYTLFTMYDLYLLSEKIDLQSEITEIISEIIRDAYTKSKNDELTTIDTFATICLHMLINKEYDEQYLLEYIEKHTDKVSGLLFENSTDDSVEAKLRFTVEIMQMLENAQIHIEYDQYKSQIEEYYRNTEFKGPAGGDTLFNSGGLSIYLMNSIDEKIDTYKLKNWYVEWKNYYNEQNINDGYDVMDCIFSFKPIADAFGDLEFVNNKVLEYISGDNIDELITSLDSPQLVYEAIRDYIKFLGEDDLYVLQKYCKEKTEYYLDYLLSPSLESNFYGLELAVMSKKEIDANKFIETSSILISDSINTSKKNDEYDNLIIDLYYYSLIYNQIGNIYGIKDSQYINYIKNAVNILDNIIGEGQINNPALLRMFMECASNNNLSISEKTIKFLKNYCKQYKDNEYFISSYFYIDLFIIDKIMNFHIIDENEVSDVISNLAVGSLFADEKGNVADVDASFLIYSYMSRFGNFNYCIDENELKKNMVANMDMKKIYEINCLLNVNEM